jgi:hypothetical protein
LDPAIQYFAQVAANPWLHVFVWLNALTCLLLLIILTLYGRKWLNAEEHEQPARSLHRLFIAVAAEGLIATIYLSLAARALLLDYASETLAIIGAVLIFALWLHSYRWAFYAAAKPQTALERARSAGEKAVGRYLLRVRIILALQGVLFVLIGFILIFAYRLAEITAAL